MNILIVLAGDSPGEALFKTEIKSADFVVAVDGGIDVFKTYNLLPDLHIGDFDSSRPSDPDAQYVLAQEDQSSTDLQKALTYIAKNCKMDSLVLLGAGGGRTDHLLHNLHICATIPFSTKIYLKHGITQSDKNYLEIITRVTPQCDFDLQVKSGTTLSVLPVGDYLGLSSSGLEWEIENKSRNEGFISQSNQVVVADPQFSILSGYVYIAVYQ